MKSQPEFVVFFAWQSDRPRSKNRDVIEAALKVAAEQLSSPQLQVRLDQDTRGVLGFCDIPATILGKISSTDAFVCDLTYVAKSVPKVAEGQPRREPRYCSNPNVLFELGYALRSAGHERIICVMNEFFGPAAEMPFDFAHRRRPVAFCCPKDGTSRAEVIQSLATQLLEILRPLVELGPKAIAESRPVRVEEIRVEFESRVRQSGLHGLKRRHGAFAIAAIPGAEMHIDRQAISANPPLPLGTTGGNIENRASGVITYAESEATRMAVTEFKTDGTILGSNTKCLDLTFKSKNDAFVPASDMDRMIYKFIIECIRRFKQFDAPFPWTFCISLLEVGGYYLETAVWPSQTKRPFRDVDIRPDPIIIRNSEQTEGITLHLALRPAFDHIWQEFGYDNCLNFTEAGAFNLRTF